MIVFSEYKLEDLILSIQTGKTPATNNPLYFNGDIPWVTPSDLRGQKYINLTERKISEQAIIDKEAFLYKKDTILISTIGDIGKTALIDKPVASNQQLTGIRVDENIILPSFFYYWVIKYKKKLEFKANKSVISILNNNNLKKISIEIPNDIEYQRKISLQLDTIQNLVDKRIRTIQIAESLILSIYIELFGHPLSNPYNLKTKKLSQLGVWQSGGTPKSDILEYYLGDIPWFTSGELGSTYLERSNKSISIQAIKNSNAKIIAPNSIMIGLYDTAAFKMSINKQECASNQAILSSKLEDEFFTLFVYYTLLLSKDYYLSKRKGARQKKLNATFVKNIKIIYPSDKNGRDKILKFYNLYYVIESQLIKLNKSLDILQSLFQSVLQNAFRKDLEIGEEVIFKELIKSLSLEDLRGNKKRLQYLIDLFKQNEFDDHISYSEAKEKLFNLILENEVQQTFDNEKITLNVK
ncbi:MAG: restriction endonuclease subunit S [Dysgonomonas sp.]